MLAGGVNLYENGRVDIHPRSLVGGGTSVYMQGGGLICAGELPTASFYSFYLGGLVQPRSRGSRVWWGCTLGGFNVLGGSFALQMRCDLYGHGLELPYIRMYLDASLPHAGFLGCVGFFWEARALACASSSTWAGSTWLTLRSREGK